MNHPSKRLYNTANEQGSITIECEKELWKRKLKTGIPIWLQIQQILKKELMQKESEQNK